MDPIARAVARSRSYRLLGRLLRRAPQADEIAYLQQIEVLPARLPSEVATGAATRYQELFGLQIFAFESAFLGTERLIGGEIADAVLHAYKRFGFAPQQQTHHHDHVSFQMDALAYLCDAEAHALEDDQKQATATVRQFQSSFLQDHLLRWLAPLAIAIQRHSSTLYPQLVDFTLALVDDHVDSLAGAQFAYELPPPPRLLTQSETTVRDIVDVLLTPAYTGLVISRRDIQRLAHVRRLPSGFGERRLMMTNLIRAAARFDDLSQLIDALGNFGSEWRDAYTALAGKHTHLSAAVRPWLLHATAMQDFFESLLRMIPEVDIGEA